MLMGRMDEEVGVAAVLANRMLVDPPRERVEDPRDGVEDPRVETDPR